MANMLSIIKDGKVTPIFPDTKCGCDHFYVRSISLPLMRSLGQAETRVKEAMTADKGRDQGCC